MNSKVLYDFLRRRGCSQLQVRSAMFRLALRGEICECLVPALYAESAMETIPWPRRRWSGLRELYSDEDSAKAAEKMKKAEEKSNAKRHPPPVPVPDVCNRLAVKGLSAYDATKSVFAFPKWIKELARYDMGVVDLDMVNTAPSMQLRRWPDMPLLKRLVEDREQFYAEVGGPRPGLKKLFSGLINGGGQRHLDEVKKTFAIDVAHQLVAGFVAEQRQIRKADAAKQKPLVDALRQLGKHFPEASLQEAMSEGAERQQLDKAIAALRDADLAVVVSIEHDGVGVVHPQGKEYITEEWMEKLVQCAATVGVQMAVKPYRSPDEILAMLMEEHPHLQWDVVDDNAVELETKRLLLGAYMQETQARRSRCCTC